MWIGLYSTCSQVVPIDADSHSERKWKADPPEINLLIFLKDVMFTT